MSPLLGTLQRLTLLLSQRSEIVVIFVVIGIVFMMILPLPTALVDTLIALNISVSILLVVLSMYLPGPLAFSTFPALLLITTLFRLALSITTTRLILLQGDAGHIVEVFGNFVVGGNLVVGLVIFMILTIVNFLVITKGSERVAEVAARFALDAMPGKQMSIDSDLRAGLLDAPTAQKKRADIGRESQLFGAMDGAMKFVKGDAIAGIIIVLINILGGFSIGVMQLGLPSEEAIKIYAILTIGDGLVAQIPALLISLTAGMIITRVTDDTAESQNVGQEMARELFNEPKAWVIAAIVMLCFAMIPGMPFFAFMTLAAIFGGFGGYKIWKLQKIAAQAAALQSQSQHADESDKLEKDVESGDMDIRTFLPYEGLAW
jgi:type III secretion protein V